MTIYQRMQQVFQTAEVPLFHMAWRATEEYPNIPETYAEYQVITSMEDWADDAPQWPRYQITAMLYCPDDPSELVEAILSQMTDERWSVRPVQEDYTPVPGGRHQYRRLIQAVFDEFWSELDPEEDA